MKTTKPTNLPSSKQHQRGAALLIAMLVVVLGLVTLLTFRSERKGPELEAERKTALALAKAKEALLGAAILDNGGGNPGRILCPDQNNNGQSQGAACGFTPPATGLVVLGRIPHQTLNIDEKRDTANERLWYIVDKEFRSKPSLINSNLTPSLLLNGQPVVATIIAPGAALANQNRPSGGGNVYSDYIEGFDGVSAVVTTAQSPSFNDRVIAITSQELFSQVTLRMARELSLTAYGSTGNILGVTIEDLPKPEIWSANHWDDAIEPTSQVADPTITLQFVNCGIVYTITGPSSVSRDRSSC